MIFFNNLFNFFKKKEKHIADFADSAKDQQLDLNYLKEIKNKIETINLSEVEPNDLCELITSFVKGQPGWMLKLRPPSIFFRGIIYPTKPEYFSNIIYPPTKIAGQNRANRTGESMFYGSFHLIAALFEINAKKGDYVAISKWGINKPVYLAQTGYLKKSFTNRREMPPWGEFNHKAFNLEVSSFVDDYIAESFSQKIISNSQNVYKLTNAIAESFLRKKEIEGMLYPSVALNGLNDNIVLKPNIIHSGQLYLIHIRWVQILDVIDNDRYVIEDLDICTEIGRDGFLSWKGEPGNWRNMPEYWYKNEIGGDTVICDSTGKIYERN
jgi:hypothetical protein